MERVYILRDNTTGKVTVISDSGIKVLAYVNSHPGSWTITTLTVGDKTESHCVGIDN